MIADERTYYRMQIENAEERRASVAVQLAAYAAQLRALEDQRAVLLANLRTVRERAAMRKELHQWGAVSRAALLDGEQQVVEARDALAEVDAAIASVRARSAEAESVLNEAEALQREHALEQIEAMSAQLLELGEQLTKLEDQVARAKIKAPTPGIVQGLRFRTIGGVVPAAALIMQIVPVEDTLVAEVQIDPRDVAFVKPGQKAIVRVQGLDASDHAEVEGRVRHISGTTFRSEQDRPYYVGIVDLQDTVVRGDGRATKSSRGCRSALTSRPVRARSSVSGVVRPRDGLGRRPRA